MTGNTEMIVIPCKSGIPGIIDIPGTFVYPERLESQGFLENVV